MYEFAAALTDNKVEEAIPNEFHPYTYQSFEDASVIQPDFHGWADMVCMSPKCRTRAAERMENGVQTTNQYPIVPLEVKHGNRTSSICGCLFPWNIIL